MAQYGRGEAGAIEAAAVDHLVVLEVLTASEFGCVLLAFPTPNPANPSFKGWTTTDAKWLDLRQKLSRVQRKSAQLMEELRVAKAVPSHGWKGMGWWTYRHGKTNGSSRVAVENPRFADWF